MDEKQWVKRTQNFVQEFKAFAIKGNVVDLAVAVVIGGAFGKIVTSLVSDIIMPLLGSVTTGINFSELTIKLGESGVRLKYGAFLQASFDFLIIALCVFIAIKALAKLNLTTTKKEDAPKPIPEDIQLLREIRDLLKKD